MSQKRANYTQKGDTFKAGCGVKAPKELPAKRNLQQTTPACDGILQLLVNSVFMRPKTRRKAG